MDSDPVVESNSMSLSSRWITFVILLQASFSKETEGGLRLLRFFFAIKILSSATEGGLGLPWLLEVSLTQMLAWSTLISLVLNLDLS